MLKTNLNKSLKKAILPIILGSCLILVLFSVYNLYKHFKDLDELEEKYQAIESVTLNSLTKRKEKREFLNRHKNCNANYLTDFFNRKCLLTDEKNNLTYLNLQPFFYKNPTLKEKLAEISESKLNYLIHDSFEKNNIKETLITLKHPVHCSYTDLIEILATVDNTSINQIEIDKTAPQIIPYELNIEFNNFDCIFNSQFLQREFK